MLVEKYVPILVSFEQSIILGHWEPERTMYHTWQGQAIVGEAQDCVPPTRASERVPPSKPTALAVPCCLRPA